MSTEIDEISVQSALDEPATWPNLTQVAGITGLSKGTVSKQARAKRISFEVRGFGQAERVVPPREVLRIGYAYHRIPRETLIDRLAGFLVGRLSLDAPLAQRAIRNRLESMVSGPAPARPEAAESLEAPTWLTEVERLRENPHALAGTIVFTSADDVVGTIELGQSVDEPSAADVSSGQARW